MGLDFDVSSLRHGSLASRRDAGSSVGWRPSLGVTTGAVHVARLRWFSGDRTTWLLACFDRGRVRTHRSSQDRNRACSPVAHCRSRRPTEQQRGIHLRRWHLARETQRGCHFPSAALRHQGVCLSRVRGSTGELVSQRRQDRAVKSPRALNVAYTDRDMVDRANFALVCKNVHGCSSDQAARASRTGSMPKYTSSGVR